MISKQRKNGDQFHSSGDCGLGSTWLGWTPLRLGLHVVYLGSAVAWASQGSAGLCYTPLALSRCFFFLESHLGLTITVLQDQTTKDIAWKNGKGTTSGWEELGLLNCPQYLLPRDYKARWSPSGFCPPSLSYWNHAPQKWCEWYQIFKTNAPVPGFLTISGLKTCKRLVKFLPSYTLCCSLLHLTFLCKSQNTVTTITNLTLSKYQRFTKQQNQIYLQWKY